MKLELANNIDVVRAMSGDIGASDVRRFEVEGVIDSGAGQLVIRILT